LFVADATKSATETAKTQSDITLKETTKSVMNKLFLHVNFMHCQPN